MKKELENCFTYLANKLSESFVYDSWDDKTKVDELRLGFRTFYDEFKKHIDFTKLTVEEAKELRMKRWDDEMPDLWLFPLYLVPIIPEGLEITFISGEKAIYKPGEMDNDIRFGCVAYGIEIKEDRCSCSQCNKEFVEGDTCYRVEGMKYCEKCYQNKQ